MSGMDTGPCRFYPASSLSQNIFFMARNDRDVEDYYAILGVAKSTTGKRIQKAFWDLARIYHPDVNPSPLAAVRFKKIVDAYQILKHSDSRNRLDARIIASFCQQLIPDFTKRHYGDRKPVCDILLALMDQLELQPVETLTTFHGIPFPKGVRYRQLLFLGPPGSRKLKMINYVCGWPEIGNLNLAQPHWWKNKNLCFRPHAVHLLLPFAGLPNALTIFDPLFNQEREAFQLDFSRIVLPPNNQWLFSIDWKNRFVFDFLLPDPETIFAWRLERRKHNPHPIDRDLTLEKVHAQYHLHEQIAKFLHMNNLKVFVRRAWDQPPLRYVSRD